MAPHSTHDAGRITWRRALLGAGAGIAGYVFASVIGRQLLRRFPIDPHSPDAWIFGAVFVGILAAGVVFVLGVAPGLSRRRALRTTHASQPGGVPPEPPVRR